MGHTIKRIAVIVLITSLVILTFLAVLAIWDVLGDDVAWKSIATMAVVSFSSLVAIIVGKSLEEKEGLRPAPPVNNNLNPPMR
jgi:hypothetical protein